MGSSGSLCRSRSVEVYGNLFLRAEIEFQVRYMTAVEDCILNPGWIGITFSMPHGRILSAPGDCAEIFQNPVPSSLVMSATFTKSRSMFCRNHSQWSTDWAMLADSL